MSNNSESESHLVVYDSSLIRLPRSRAWDEDLAAAAKSIQPCPTLCDPIDSSPPGSPVPGILQARTLEWVAISFSNAWKWRVKVKLLSCVWLLATPWTAAHQAPPSMGFSRQEYWSGVPLPSPTLCIGNTFSATSKTFLSIGVTMLRPFSLILKLCLHLLFNLHESNLGVSIKHK